MSVEIVITRKERCTEVQAGNIAILDHSTLSVTNNGAPSRGTWLLSPI
jgi:hypothetical protein